MNLEYPGLEPFEPTLRRLMGIAFDPPLPCTKSALLILRWAPGDRRRRFIAATFAAYDELQRAVAEEVICLERQARALTGEVRVARRARDRVSATLLEQKIAIVRRRQLILRRMMDAVMYILCDQYVWFIRRLALHDDVRPIDPDNLAHMVEEATRLNQQNPYVLYIASDLTTSVQLGDFIQVSIDARLLWRIRIVEVKEGEVNKILAKQLAAGTSAEDLLAIRQTIGKKAAKQAERMLRQQHRLKGLSDIVRAGRGIDPRTGHELRRTRDRPPTPGYQPELRALIEKASKDGQHLIKLDGCLTLAAARAETLPEPQLCSAVHSLFHYNHSAAACLLPTGRAQEEVNLLLEEPPVIDLVEHTYKATWGVPVFSWGTLDQVCDLLTGRVKVYAQFDAEAFMQQAAARFGIRMKWLTGRRAEMLRKTGGTQRIPGSPNAAAISVELPDGTRFELLSGGLGRMFLEQAKPDTILRYLLTLGSDVRKL